jgi:hypothetical protein
MHGPAMIERAVWLASNAKLEATQLAAISLVLERGYGKAPHVITGEGVPIQIIISSRDNEL